MTWSKVMLRAAERAARDVGVRVIEVNGWKTRGHGSTPGRLLGTMTHDTVTPFSWSDAQLARLLRDGYARLPGPIANVGIGTTGNIILIAAGRAYHAGAGQWGGIPSGNLNTVGIETQCPGRPHPWNKRQYDANLAFVCHLHDLAGLSEKTAVGHKEWARSRKVDPWSVDMAQFRRNVHHYLNPAPAPAPVEVDPMSSYGPELRAIAANTENTLAELQQLRRTNVALLEDTIARVRRAYGLGHEPKSDRIWAHRIASGSHTLEQAKKALKAKAETQGEVA